MRARHAVRSRGAGLARGGIGANVGLVVAAMTIAFIVFRLVQSGAPLPTVVELGNHTQRAVTVGKLQFGSETVLAAPFTLAARGSDGQLAAPASAQARLGPGRAVRIEASLLTPDPLTAACEMPPRPHGVCRVGASFHGGAELHCEYACAASSPQ